MGLEEGNLDGLSADHKFTLPSGRPELCLQQMLSALDFLAYQSIIHRDVKPENIYAAVPWRDLDTIFDYLTSELANWQSTPIHVKGPTGIWLPRY